jgi:hypothetical protein
MSPILFNQTIGKLFQPSHMTAGLAMTEVRDEQPTSTRQWQAEPD